MTLVLYVTLPMPGLLALKWFGAGLVQRVLLGALAASIYKPRHTRSDREA
ncbi:MAG: hypothetical protein H0X73_06135 [Chthoniobacterales bacterium]|nr:hypothetical protein [Chthoniobacterales bacterium]